MRLLNYHLVVSPLCLFVGIALSISMITLSVKTNARSLYVKNYNLPNYTEFHGKVKSGEFDEYHVFLQKSQSIRMEISDKRLELSIAGPTHIIRESKRYIRLDKGNIFTAPASGIYTVIVKSTHQDKQCNCYVLAINFAD